MANEIDGTPDAQIPKDLQAQSYSKGAMSQMQSDPLFWLKEPLYDSEAPENILALSKKLLDGPLESSKDQALIRSSLQTLLTGWEQGMKSVMENYVVKAEGTSDPNRIYVAVLMLLFTRNQLRTLYNNLAITVQRLERRYLA
jgi:hypothetical protein